MVNYDLPWNPNRLEQRFGRIHRIGQTEVCHLWNLVSADTREGEVYARLLEKLERAREALGGRDSVYDVLGERGYRWPTCRATPIGSQRRQIRHEGSDVIEAGVDAEELGTSGPVGGSELGQEQFPGTGTREPPRAA